MTFAELLVLHADLERERQRLYDLSDRAPERMGRPLEDAASSIVEVQRMLRTDIGQAALDEVFDPEPTALAPAGPQKHHDWCENNWPTLTAAGVYRRKPCNCGARPSDEPTALAWTREDAKRVRVEPLTDSLYDLPVRPFDDYVGD